MTFLQLLQSWDAAVFHFINSDLSNPLFDWLLPLCREKWIWAPLYLFLGAFAWLNYGRRGGWFIVLGLVTTVWLSDFISSELIKKNVQRLRPCNEPALAESIVERVDCGGGYSFTSSHAANHFGVAVFLIGVFGGLARWVKPVALAWPGLVAFAQVYVGLHYPGDVIGGGLLGSMIGWLVWRVWRRYQ